MQKFYGEVVEYDDFRCDGGDMRRSEKYFRQVGREVNCEWGEMVFIGLLMLLVLLIMIVNFFN